MLGASWTPDHLKLLFLFVCFAACLSTLWTTLSFEMGPRRAPNLAPNVNGWCYNQLAALRECKKRKGDQECQGKELQALQSAVLSCEKSVKSAYRFLNLGGACHRERNVLFLCREEWCESAGDRNNLSHGKSKDTKSSQCEKECSKLNTALQTCIDSTVRRYMKHNKPMSTTNVLVKGDSVKDKT